MKLRQPAPFLGLIFCGLILLVLGACGDNTATSSTAPTTAAATSAAAATTAAMTSAAAATSAASTVAATTSAATTSTAAGTTSAVTTSVATATTSAATTSAATTSAATTAAATSAATTSATTSAVTTVSTANAAPPSGDITVYTSEPQDLVNQMKADFEKAYPGVKLNIFRDGTEKVIAKIQAEQQAGAVQADLLWFANYAYLKGLADKDQLVTYNPPEAAKLPTAYKYLDGKMYEVRLIYNIIGVNTSAVKTKPTGWKSLTDAEYKGKIGLASPSYSGAALSTLGVLVQDSSLGWDYYQKLKDNGAVVEQSNGTVANKLVSGEYGVVSVVDFQIRAAANNGSPVEQVWPSEGAVLIPTPIAVLKSSKNQAAAQAFISYALSARGQNLLVSQNYIPVIPDIQGPKGAPAVSSIKTYPSAEEYVGKNSDDLKKHFDQVFGAK